MDEDGEAEERCLDCGGDGWVFGYELNDPLWYDDGEAYRCENCGGSGLLKDCTVF